MNFSEFAIVLMNKNYLFFCILFALSSGCNRRRSLAEDAILAIGTSTSFSDSGRKAIVFGDGTMYIVYRHWTQSDQARNTPYRILKGVMTINDRGELRKTFRRNTFFSLPRLMRREAMDGSEHRLVVADKNHCHGTFNYLFPNKQENAIRSYFHSLLDRYVESIAKDSSSDISEMELLQQLKARTTILNIDGCKRRLADGWQSYIVPYLLRNARMHSDTSLQNVLMAMPKIFDNSNPLFPFP